MCMQQLGGLNKLAWADPLARKITGLLPQGMQKFTPEYQAEKIGRQLTPNNTPEPASILDEQQMGPNGQLAMAPGQQVPPPVGGAVPPTLGAAMARNPAAYQTQPGGKPKPVATGAGI